MAWEVLADYSTMFPPYFLMERAFDDYKLDSKPAGAHPTNQCAIRMSIALGRSGFSLSAFPVPHRVKTTTHLPVPYVMGANELAEYLKTLWGYPVVFRSNLNTVTRELSNRKGIIYFNNCFHRSEDPEGSRQGDHIDLWNGSHYYNQLYNIRAGMEDRLSSGPLFTRSNSVWFFELF